MHETIDRALFVHAHPDDESISSGATIASLAAEGVAVTVVTCTRGERGEVIPLELRHLEGDGPALAAHREVELAEAVEALGVAEHRFLGAEGARRGGLEPRRYTDSGMVWADDGRPAPDGNDDPTTLCAAPLGEVVADVAEAARASRADVIVSYDAAGGYGHPDHIRAHEAAKAAAEQLGIAFWCIVEPGSPTQDGDITFAVEPVFEEKRRALSAHRTQITVEGTRPDTATFSLSSGEPRRLSLGEAIRMEAAAPERAPSLEPRGRGARLLVAAIALLFGAVLGLLLTLQHQQTFVVGEVVVPIGLIVVLPVAAVFVLGLRLAFDSRVFAVSGSIGMLMVTAVLALEGPGGSVVTPDNLASYVWLYGLVVTCLLVLLWPRLPQRASR